MNGTFKILWFEDEKDWYDMEKRRIISIIKDHYLNDDITRKYGDDFTINDINDNKYDLILMDFKLAAGATGTNIGSNIRNNNILTDILFYSSQKQEMLKEIYHANPPIDGVYFADREYQIFADKVEGLINKIIRRSEDLINLRGFVLDVSCDFEIRVQDVLNQIWNKLKSNERKMLDEKTLFHLNKKAKDFNKAHNDITSNDSAFSSVMEKQYFFCHSDRLHLLNKAIAILKSNYGFNSKSKEIFDNFCKSYEDNISHYRNALGHKRATENKIEITKGHFINIDEDLHEKMRSNLQEYDTYIKEIEDFVDNVVQTNNN